MMNVILAYAPFLEIGFGLLAACAVVEFVMEKK
jgi:hypothetical protein